MAAPLGKDERSLSYYHETDVLDAEYVFACRNYLVTIRRHVLDSSQDSVYLDEQFFSLNIL